MRRMDWRWRDLLEFPHDYLPILFEILRQEDSERRLRESQARRRPRR